jgi:hypothetical protein
MDHLMDVLGQHLNLRKHLVGKQRAAIVGPGDIEGHLGTDGRYYLLDFARLMPPETPLPEYVLFPFHSVLLSCSFILAHSIAVRKVRSMEEECSSAC